METKGVRAIAAVCLHFSPREALLMSFQYYVSIKGKTQGQFKPESKKEGRKDKWMECVAFDMGSAFPIDSNSGEPKGFRQHQPLTITKEFGAASPQALQAHYTAEVLTEVVIEIVGRDEGGTKEKVKERITLTDAVLCKVHRYSLFSAKEKVEHDVDFLEDLGFTFRKIMIENPIAGTSTSDDWTSPDR